MGSHVAIDEGDSGSRGGSLVRPTDDIDDVEIARVAVMARPRKDRKRYKGGRLIPEPEKPDWGAPQLANHAVLISRETMRGQKGAINSSECLLDVLLHSGALGKGQKAEDRHGAGIWLRGLHERALAEKVTQGYERVDGSEADRPIGFYLKVRERMGELWGIARQVCIEERVPDRIHEIDQALDRLYNLRLAAR